MSVVAYPAVQLIRTKLMQYEVNDNWGTLQQDLQHKQRIVTTQLEKTVHRVRNNQGRKLTDRQRKLATNLGLDPRCHGNRIRLEPEASPNDYAPNKAASHAKMAESPRIRQGRNDELGYNSSDLANL